jgi:hypothetical protein
VRDFEKKSPHYPKVTHVAIYIRPLGRHPDNIRTAQSNTDYPGKKHLPILPAYDPDELIRSGPIQLDELQEMRG